MRYLLALLILVSSSLSSCFLLYQQDIEQGNVITREMIPQVRTGMTREQVRFVLGTPLISDVFHKDRWDYYYSFRPEGRKATKKHRITIFFSDNKVSRILFNDELKKQRDNHTNAG